MSTPVVQLAALQTEHRNPRTVNIDRVPTLELCRIINREDSSVPSAVEPCLPVIANVIDVLSERVRNGGRVFYIGAGTSGRLGVLDASEIPPTYSAPPGQFIALMAGGDYALRNAKEGAEDDRDAAKADLQPFDFNPTLDSLIGIASSGRTPYVLGGLAHTKSLGATTVALVCVSPSAAAAEGNADFVISAVTGPEPVTGSTRMKAGTATKLVLNMISSGIMIKLGKTYGNLMIDVRATNIKLKQRARNILRFVGGQACTQTDEELDQILQECQGSVKLAAARIVLGLSVKDAEDRLQRNQGVLARVFEEAHQKNTGEEDGDDELVLCVDAGGTSCKAVILSKDGHMGTGTSGPCNVYVRMTPPMMLALSDRVTDRFSSNVGIEGVISTMSMAIQEAVDDCLLTKGRHFQDIRLSGAWVGMAGYARPSLASVIDNAVSKLIRLSPGRKLKITTDIDLLPVSVSDDEDLDNIIVLVAGTGSIAMSYAKVDGQFQRMHRAGGWGYLLGDDGSGYGIGRLALRSALYSSDFNRIQASNPTTATTRTLDRLSQAVIQHFKDLYPDSEPQDLLSTVLFPGPGQHQSEGASLATTKRIASVAKVVLSLAGDDDEAKRIVEAGVASLVDLVALLVHGQRIDPARSALLIAGGMFQDRFYRNSLEMAVEAKCGRFKLIETVTQPAVACARHLLRQGK